MKSIVLEENESLSIHLVNKSMYVMKTLENHALYCSVPPLYSLITDLL